jgi:erythromycin esterase-like protein/predicted phosphoribosyltransferase
VRRFRDRAEAGRLLAEELTDHRGRDGTVVLGLPRGGVPVAFEVARALEAPLDVFVVRKLGVPGHEELALGAIATGGVRVLNKSLLEQVSIPAEWIEAIDAKERRELERREQAYRGDWPPPDLAGRTVILVDDGLATGSTMSAAVQAVRLDDPVSVVVAVPVADPGVLAALGEEAEEAVSVLTPQPLAGVGAWYEDFSQTSDEEVRELLARTGHPPLAKPLDVRPLKGEVADYDPLLERAAGMHYVLLGEASHGTHEFYRERAEITKRLIAEAGFTAVAIEADWPDAYRVNHYIRGAGEDADAEQALSDFRRFPVWMWRNTESAELVEVLREWNDLLPAGERKVGFYGLDLYSLYTSIEAVIAYLDQVDPDAAERAAARYSCFDHFSRDPQVYAYEAGLAGAESCEQEAVQQLMDLRSVAGEAIAEGRDLDVDEQFQAEQNARLVVNAEEYYRAMFRGGILSWNLRDQHMADTLGALTSHLERDGKPARIVVWAHNSHVGDARATELGQAGELNLGQLVRERVEDKALLVGFTTYEGTVTAASDWGGEAERKRVRRALPGSWEELFHESDSNRFLADRAQLKGRRLERAIGVVYRPETERLSHYFNARIGEQFDAVVHLDQTQAVEPLETTSEWQSGELPETYPHGV